jgi:hypothetical protein
MIGFESTLVMTKFSLQSTIIITLTFSANLTRHQRFLNETLKAVKRSKRKATMLKDAVCAAAIETCCLTKQDSREFAVSQPVIAKRRREKNVGGGKTVNESS